MDNSNTQTHDFINIESFSRLPFAPRLSPKEKSIRLFGKEFGGGDDLATIITDESGSDETSTFIPDKTEESRENGRKFECNYCCRIFPTSQALGGHQNAHRRERSQAKRTFIQPFTIHRSSAKPQPHSFVNHHHHSLTTTTSPPYHHQSTISNITNVRFYRGKTSYTSHQTPIDGRPLALWRFPTAVHNSPTFNHGGLLSSSDSGLNYRNLCMEESQADFRDQVSLDLHL